MYGMYEVRKTDKDRFAVRNKNADGLFISGTGKIIDSHKSNIAIYQNKDDAFLKAIEFNRRISDLFDEFINKDRETIENEIKNESSIIEGCKKKIEILNCVLHCKDKREKK